jgi:hypothetical protein
MSERDDGDENDAMDAERWWREATRSIRRNAYVAGLRRAAEVAQERTHAIANSRLAMDEDDDWAALPFSRGREQAARDIEARLLALADEAEREK